MRKAILKRFGRSREEVEQPSQGARLFQAPSDLPPHPLRTRWLTISSSTSGSTSPPRQGLTRRETLRNITPSTQGADSSAGRANPTARRPSLSWSRRTISAEQFRRQHFVKQTWLGLHPDLKKGVYQNVESATTKSRRVASSIDSNTRRFSHSSLSSGSSGASRDMLERSESENDLLFRKRREKHGAPTLAQLALALERSLSDSYI